ncbi:hypothetical protein [Sinomonas humi]|uniref:hypothetical protein n=1 Tax=Sinomonas humi TaxID=1338436 RepID=UPI0012E03759|nr:hypothetical protein [Sinomonas humi]
MLSMSKALVVCYLGIVAYAIGYSGRFKLPVVIPPGSPRHKFLGRVNLALHGFAIVVSISLPLASGFAGSPILSYSSGALVAVSLPLRRWKPLTPSARFVWDRGRRGKPLPEGERSTWPYALICGTGYAVMLVYIQTIFGALF